MFSLNFMFFCSLIEELCTKEENYKTSCNFNFGHECRMLHDPHAENATLSSDSIILRLRKHSESDV